MERETRAIFEGLYGEVSRSGWHWWLCKHDEAVVAVANNTWRARAKMGFSPLVAAVAIVWGRMTLSLGNGGGITASHKGGITASHKGGW